MCKLEYGVWQQMGVAFFLGGFTFSEVCGRDLISEKFRDRDGLAVHRVLQDVNNAEKRNFLPDPRQGGLQSLQLLVAVGSA